MDFSSEFFTHRKNGDLEYIQINRLNEAGLVKHCFMTRKGGVSKGEYEGFNVWRKGNDEPENIQKNREIILNELGIKEANIICPNQIHEDNVVVIETGTEDLSTADGTVTNVANMPLMTLYADCVPLLFLDPIKRVIGNSHAGWKGTAKKIGQKTVKKMINQFGCNPADILVGIGPSIGQCCFETDQSVAKEFKEAYRDFDCFSKKVNDKYFINLWQANKIGLIEIGVPEENIFINGICTVCNKDYFFSHRAFKGKTGRSGAIISLI